jgi:alpha-tubulin suppressor-like RCC1 family protein
MEGDAMRISYRSWVRSALVVFVLGCGDKPVEPELKAIDFTGPNRLAVGDVASCAIDFSQQALCWGWNTNYRDLGFDPATAVVAVTPWFAGAPQLVSLASGGSQHRCGLTGGGVAVCWGRGAYGQLGRGVLEPLGNAPGEVLGGANWRSIHTGRIHTCGIDLSGDAWCWGINARGELGNADAAHGAVNPPSTSPTPLKVSGGLKWKTLAPGWQHTCGVAQDNTAWCWGNNSFGELGIGLPDTTSHLVPVPVAGGHHFKELAAGWRYTCGITTENAAMCWGWNESGQLGDGTTTYRTAPQLVAGGHSFARIAVSFNYFQPGGTIQNAFGFACAIRIDGAPFCWGKNDSGQLGDGTMTDRLVPTMVSGDLIVTSIATGSNHTCAMKGNSVWCWGSRQSSQLGHHTDLISPPILTPFLVAYPFGGL